MPITGSAAVAGGGLVYVDRGDPSDWDWTQADLTLDGTYRDLDMSGIITDSTAVLAHMRVFIRDNTVTDWLVLRENGNTNGHNSLAIYNQVANVSIGAEGVVVLDADQKIEYAGSTGLDVAYIVVRGWWKPA